VLLPALRVKVKPKRYSQSSFRVCVHSAAQRRHTARKK